MDEIKQIYTNDSYSPFINYCERHHYKWMRDLINCRFEELPELIGIAPSLLNRIKSIFVLYLKKHPECLNAKPAKTKTALPMDDLNDRLHDIFEQNANKLIHISDITKAIGKSVKRNDLINTLEHQKWCRIVDSTTFFYVPGE
ncbi:hypothetical protein ACS3UN_05145 [Oscillospiraceae bacterium LTW-04]|nr:hypothetical protein RBH76_05220 [Oscillospiraceae bacterium MB24-C1]